MANMALQGHSDRLDSTKVECSATHSEEPPVSADNDQEQEQEQYATRKIDIRTILGILVSRLHPHDSIPFKVDKVESRLWQSLTNHACSHSSSRFQSC